MYIYIYIYPVWSSINGANSRIILVPVCYFSRNNSEGFCDKPAREISQRSSTNRSSKRLRPRDCAQEIAPGNSTRDCPRDCTERCYQEIEISPKRLGRDMFTQRPPERLHREMSRRDRSERSHLRLHREMSRTDVMERLPREIPREIALEDLCQKSRVCTLARRLETSTLSQIRLSSTFKSSAFYTTCGAFATL